MSRIFDFSAPGVHSVELPPLGTPTQRARVEDLDYGMPKRQKIMDKRLPRALLLAAEYALRVPKATVVPPPVDVIQPGEAKWPCGCGKSYSTRDARKKHQLAPGRCSEGEGQAKVTDAESDTKDQEKTPAVVEAPATVKPPPEVAVPVCLPCECGRNYVTATARRTHQLTAGRCLARHGPNAKHLGLGATDLPGIVLLSSALTAVGAAGTDPAVPGTETVADPRPRFPCECGREFASRDARKTHQTVAGRCPARNPQPATASAPPLVPEEKLLCECGREFSSKDTRRKHQAAPGRCPVRVVVTDGPDRSSTSKKGSGDVISVSGTVAASSLALASTPAAPVVVSPVPSVRASVPTVGAPTSTNLTPAPTVVTPLPTIVPPLPTIVTPVPTAGTSIPVGAAQAPVSLPVRPIHTPPPSHPTSLPVSTTNASLLVSFPAVPVASSPIDTVASLMARYLVPTFENPAAESAKMNISSLVSKSRPASLPRSGSLSLLLAPKPPAPSIGAPLGNPIEGVKDLDSVSSVTALVTLTPQAPAVNLPPAVDGPPAVVPVSAPVERIFCECGKLYASRAARRKHQKAENKCTLRYGPTATLQPDELTK